jgi:predicted dehydrogenase
MATTGGGIGRRTFLRRAGGAAAVAAGGFPFPTIVPGRALGAGGIAPASERVRIGQVGVGNQGGKNLKVLLKDTVAVSDVDRSRLSAAKEQVEKANGAPCAAFGDYRRLLDDKDIDAVVVTTPDHWHALVTIDACAAGKDVYCEKPLSLTVAEGRAMVEAARKYGRVVQTGSQQRSDARFRLACERVRGGDLGKIKAVQVVIPGVNFQGPPVADGSPPPELDYDFWLGPAPSRPYNAKHVHYNFRFFWDYSGGQLTNWGAHHLDIVQWALGHDDGGPVAVEGRARYQADRWYEVPEWSETTFTYADGVRVTCTQGEANGITFEGEKGTLFVTRGKISSDPAEIVERRPADGDVHLEVSANHHRNWLDCIKTRARPICDVAIGHRSATVCHLGNIALRTGRKITWDPAREQVVGDAEASAMLARPYRAPWHLPEGTRLGAVGRST